MFGHLVIKYEYSGYIPEYSKHCVRTSGAWEFDPGWCQDLGPKTPGTDVRTPFFLLPDIRVRRRTIRPLTADGPPRGGGRSGLVAHVVQIGISFHQHAEIELNSRK